MTINMVVTCYKENDSLTHIMIVLNFIYVKNIMNDKLLIVRAVRGF